MMNAQVQPALRGYHPLIAEATGYTDVATLQAIEDCMRDTIFHSNLDWLGREQFDGGARDAVDVLVAMGKIEPRATLREPLPAPKPVEVRPVAAGATYRCSECGGANVEVCLPAWFAPNDDWRYVEPDAEADERASYCNDCGDERPLVRFSAEDAKKRIADIDGTLNAVRQGWVSGYTTGEVAALQAERQKLAKALS